MDITNSTGSTDTDINPDPSNYPLPPSDNSNMSTNSDSDAVIVPTNYPLLINYEKISLNKMLLYTGELIPLIQNYIITDNPDKVKFLEHIYAERATSGIEINHDWETVENVIPYDIFPVISTLDATLDASITDTRKMAIKCAYNCLMYAYSIHFSYKNEPINTLFLNPFFFPFHRAFILADGLHDLLTQRGKIAEFYSRLVKDKKYRNRKDLQNAVVHTAVKPENDWCDKISQPYLADWENLNVKGGHTLMESLDTQERLFANVILKQKKLYDSLINFTIVNAADKKKISVVGNTSGGDDNDDDDDAVEDNSFTQFDTDFSEKIKQIFNTQVGNNFGVLDCSGPKKTQFNAILRNNKDIDPNEKAISSIISGTLDSSTNNDGPLSKHLYDIFRLLGYVNLERICIFLPEASMQNSDRSIKEVMQRIIINAVNNAERKMDMFFELWSAPKNHCPNIFTKRSNLITIEDDQKCPGVNETIEYIFNNHGLKSDSFLKQLASCCLFGIAGLSDKKLKTIENTNNFLDKYNQAFLELNLQTMNENGGCLFRVKTMGDFYRLADTALIQYLLPVGTQAHLGTCDGYNAANAFSSNNFPTIYGKPKTSFSCYSPIVLTPAELRQLEEQQRLDDLAKKAQQLVDKKTVVKELIDNVYILKGKLERGDSKISKSLKKLTDWLDTNKIEKIKDLVERTNVLISAIQTSVVDKNITEWLQDDGSRGFIGYKKLFDANKIDWMNTISVLQINALNKIYTYFALYLLECAIQSYKKTILANLEGKTVVGLKTSIDETRDIESLDIDFVNKFPGVTFLNTLNNYELVDTIEFLKEEDINTIITSLDIWFDLTNMTVKPIELYKKSTSKKIKLLQQKAYDKLVSYLIILTGLEKNDNNLTIYEYMLGLFLSSLNLDAEINKVTNHSPMIDKLFFSYPSQDKTYSVDVLEQIKKFPGVLDSLIDSSTKEELKTTVSQISTSLSTTPVNSNEIQAQIIATLNASINKSIENIYNIFPTTEQGDDTQILPSLKEESQVGGAGELDNFDERILNNTVKQNLTDLYELLKNETINTSTDIEVFNNNKLDFSIKYINLVNMLDYVIDSVLEYDYKDKKIIVDTNRKILSNYLNKLNIIVSLLSYQYYLISISEDKIVITEEKLTTNSLSEQIIKAIIAFDRYKIYNLEGEADLSESSSVSGVSKSEHQALMSEYVRQLESLRSGESAEPVLVEPLVQETNEERIKKINYLLRRRLSNNTPTNSLRKLQHELKELQKQSSETNIEKIPPPIRRLSRRLSGQPEENIKPPVLPIIPEASSSLNVTVEKPDQLSTFAIGPTEKKSMRRKSSVFSKPVKNDPRIRTLSHTDTQNKSGVLYENVGNKRVRLNGRTFAGGKRIRTRKYITKMKKRTRKLNKRLKKRHTKHKKHRVKKYTRRL